MRAEESGPPGAQQEQEDPRGAFPSLYMAAIVVAAIIASSQGHCRCHGRRSRHGCCKTEVDCAHVAMLAVKAIVADVAVVAVVAVVTVVTVVAVVIVVAFIAVVAVVTVMAVRGQKSIVRMSQC